MGSSGRSPKQALKQAVDRSISGAQPATWQTASWPARGLAIATGLYAVVLVVATHYPRPEELLGRNPPPDKLLHFLAYGLLGLLAAATLRAFGRWSTRSALRLGLALALAAVIDEATQPLCSRAAEPLDWVCDCIGIALGIAAVPLLTCRNP
jgi:hypothetical protein